MPVMTTRRASFRPAVAAAATVCMARPRPCGGSVRQHLQAVRMGHVACRKWAVWCSCSGMGHLRPRASICLL